MIKKIFFWFTLSVNAVLAQKPQDLLIPSPKEYNSINSCFIVSTAFAIAVKGNPNERIYAAATRILQRLKGRTGLFIAQSSVTRMNTDSTMVIEVKRPGVNRLFEDESYQLNVMSTHILLKSETDIGAIHGLETLLQLLQSDNNGYYFPGCLINDAPRFFWRGLLIDVGRHFMPVDVIKHNIDAMAAVKMNVLHLHLTEDQGFRIECKTFPKLHQLGSDGQFFTQEQIREIITYADDRGIRVIPEFDIPGHTTSWFVGYPELASGTGPYDIEHRYGMFVPTMNPIKEETYQFLDSFFKEMTGLFPDEYVHIGGDENNGKEWDDNTSIQAFKKANNLPDNPALQAYFNKRVLEILTKYGKKMIGWDEIIQPDLPKNIVIQSWRGKQGLIDAAQNGFQVILSNGYYIDLVQPAEFHYLNDPLPAAIPLSDEQKKLVIGGEATMWSELVTWETIDSRIWPRTAAIAERLWSPATVADVHVMYDKLDKISIQLEELGLTHEKNYEMMLRRLVGNNDIKALKTFVDVIEPIKNYHRVSTKEVHYLTDSPYARIADAARPESRIARHFNDLVGQFLVNRNDKAMAEAIRHYLKLWASNHSNLVKIIQKTPVLKEVETLSADLAVISKIGLEAIIFLEGDQKAQKSWHDSSMHKIQLASKPRGQTEIAMIKGIQKLLDNVKY